MEHEGQRLVRGLGAKEEPAEHLVVPGDVVAPAHQRGPSGPVQVDQVGRVQPGQCRTVDQHIPGADREPGRAEFAGKPDEQRSEGVLRHRR
jgi:hypothetical protein